MTPYSPDQHSIPSSGEDSQPIDGANHQHPANRLFPTRRLSKSRYLSGLQCHKRLFLDVYAPELSGPVDAQRQAIMDMGKDIEAAARECFPNGRLVTAGYRQSAKALAQTAELMGDKSVSAIFEAAFQFEDIFVRVDVLERSEPDAWRLIEIKAAARVKAVHLDDLTVQAYVLGGCGVNLSGSYLMHVNRHYVFPGGDLDTRKLFAIEDATEEVAGRLPEVPGRVAHMRGVLTASQPPTIAPGTHCHSPHVCPFWDYCTEDKSSRWIFHLPGNKQLYHQLSQQGIETIDDIPPGFSLTDIQHRIKENVEWMDPQLLTRLQEVRYPVHHLDFETLMPGLPLYPGTRPYQPLPVQWSNHIEFEDQTLRHEGFLSRSTNDPREELAVRLVASLGADGTICVYSEYERFILLSLAESVPALKHELLSLVGRLWDLLSVIQQHYYHPGFQGCFSIKSVLPALIPSLSYDDLTIQDGVQAAAAHYRLVFTETDWVEKERLGAALSDYCSRDTLAMVELRKVLLAKALYEFQESGTQHGVELP